GGMVGAAYHAACLQKPDGWPARTPGPCSFRAPDQTALSLDGMVRDLANDALSPVIHRLLFYDLWSVVWPWPFSNDRARGFEAGGLNTLPAPPAHPLGALAAGEREGWRPVLVFSPMLVEDGRRLLISNEPLGYLTDVCWPSLEGSHHSHSTAAVQFADLFPQ